MGHGGFKGQVQHFRNRRWLRMGKNYCHLELQLRLGLQPGAIADGLLRAPSTVMREMQRNGWRTQSERGPQRVAGGYRSLPAQRRAQRLATKPRVSRKLIVGTPLWSQVVDALHQGLSPAQIARTLARMPDPVRQYLPRGTDLSPFSQ